MARPVVRRRESDVVAVRKVRTRLALISGEKSMWRMLGRGAGFWALFVLDLDLVLDEVVLVVDDDGDRGGDDDGGG